MIVAPSLVTFVDNPKDDMRRTASNNKLNKGKGAKLQLAREVELKAREKEAGEVSDETQAETAQQTPPAKKRAPSKRKPTANAAMPTPATSTVPTPVLASVVPKQPARAAQGMSYAPVTAVSVPLTPEWCPTTTADVAAAHQFPSMPAMWSMWMGQQQFPGSPRGSIAATNVQATGLPMMGGPFNAMLANSVQHSPLSSSRKRGLQEMEDNIAVCSGRPAKMRKW
jgi:hypothetical protein